MPAPHTSYNPLVEEDRVLSSGLAVVFTMSPIKKICDRYPLVFWWSLLS